MMTGTKSDIEKFDGKNDFALWQKKLYTFHMHPGKSQSEHIDEFHKLVGDLATIDAAISDKDQALLLLTSLPSSYDNFVETLLYGRDTMKLEDVVATLNSRELQKMRDGSSFVLDNVRYVPELRRNLISLGTLEKEGFTVKMQSGKIKVKKGSLMRSTQQCTKSGVAKHLGVAGLQQQNGLVKETNVTLLAKVVLYRNMGFNESGEYKKTFIGSGVGTGSMQVLQGDEFEVEPQDGHTFEGATLSMGTNQYREDSNEAAFAVAAVEKIYAYESLTFNNTVACEVISKWKAGLKDDMDARSDVYVLSNGCKKCSDDSDGYYWESTPGDCDVEKNGKWSCIYAVGSQEYQMVCTRLDIASADVDQSQAAYMTLTEAAKEAIWLKRLAIESGFELKIVAGIATGALSKAIPSPRFQHRLNLLSIGIG
ncbi:hypothetical protein Tco_0388671 [Tanacetum coccineum]